MYLAEQVPDPPQRNRERRLARVASSSIQTDYEYILVDCPPSARHMW